MIETKKAVPGRVDDGDRNADRTEPRRKNEAREAAPPSRTRPEPPHSLMRDFFGEMQGLFDGLGGDLVRRGRDLLGWEASLGPLGWAPRIEVTHQGDAFRIKAELPGMAKEDVTIDVREDVLTLSGVRREEKREERDGRRYSELRYGSFRRSIPLPPSADVGAATARFRDGLLEIAIPTPTHDEPATRKIPIEP